MSRIYRGLLSGENIVVYGDFDADGVTATALMVEGLSLLNAKVTPYIPHRMTEGYGLKAASLEALKKQGADLVISVDCGVTALAPLKRAKRLGLDVVVTDHHVPLEEIPEAAAVVDPKLQGSRYPFNDFSGVGVAFKVLQAIFRGVGKGDQLEGLLDLVALGTVADMAPLLGENRYLVKLGLALLNENPRLGVRELMAQAGVESGSVGSESISWSLAPRLNAAGRLEHAMASYDLLTTGSQDEAQRLAEWLHKKNLERQDLTTKALKVAREKVGATGIDSVLVAGDSEFPAGICGLVAGRLCEEFYRPAIVVRTAEQFCSGSCRSIPEFNIIEAMNSFQSDVGGLVHFGGHAQAAGFTMLTKNLPRLAEYLAEVAGVGLKGLDLRPRIDIDAEVKFSELGGDVFPTIQKLGPFGQGNPQPTFLSRGVEVVECRTMGNGGQHLRMRLRQGGVVWSAVAFGLGCLESQTSSLVDIVYNVEVDRWNGSARLRLNVVDLCPSATRDNR